MPASDAKSECDDQYKGKHPTIRYLQLKLEDVDEEEISRFFEPAFAFMDQAINKEDGSVLVHCQAGISRSATIVASYLMRANSMSMDQALEQIKSKRSKASPNGSFLR